MLPNLAFDSRYMYYVRLFYFDLQPLKAVLVFRLSKPWGGESASSCEERGQCSL